MCRRGSRNAVADDFIVGRACRSGMAPTQHQGGIAGLLQLLDGRVVECPELDAAAPSWMTTCLQKYANLSPQLADATLLYLAEREEIDSIFTLDRRDFSIYRTRKKRRFVLLPE
jgi:hypothetical protein